MATVKINDVSPIDIESAEGAHVMMQSLHRYMTEVGLTEVSIAGGYDGSEAGLLDQVPETRGNYSQWMAFGFSDLAQSSHPIYISFRVGFGSMGSTSSSYSRYPVSFRISTDISELDGTATRNVLTAGYLSGSSSSSSYKYTSLPNAGDFIRYTGDALTLVFGAGAARANSYGQRELISLHVERQKLLDGSFLGGPAVVANTNSWSPSSSASPASYVYWDAGEEAIKKERSCATRVGGSLAYRQNGVPIVAPIYYKSAVLDELVPMRYAFTLPDSALTGYGLVSLDFEGKEKRYLHSFSEITSSYPHQFRIGYSDQAPIFSWDE